ncbi:MAG: ATP-binding region, ATPase-like [uncultured Thermomicrobiales bacterium]|uniref:histidine kinase n=1 Tax=uncultured Thermomicrobiales bacterium TaxID=1645740 RepID=A0A6J4UZT8_9BACT|nr:MAG: ATP-binding region, ATPase-like [uncultured Thermomicrobiales bacterium]
MRFLAVPRDRLPFLAIWLLVLGLVVGVNAASIPSEHGDMVSLADFPAEQRDGVRHALDALHLSPTHLSWYWIVTDALTTLIYLVMGWLLVQRGQPVWFSSYIAIVTMALGAATYPPSINETYPDRPVLQVIVLVLTVTAVSGFFILPLIFPDGRFVPRWTVLAAVYVMFSFALFDLSERVEFLGSVAFDVGATLVLVAILLGTSIYRYHRVSTPGQRRQTRVVLLGFVIGLPAFFAGDAMMRNIDSSPTGIAFLFGFMILIQVGFNAPFLAIGASMLFHRLFDIDVILSRTLTWLAMTGVVIGTYIGIVVGIGRLLDTERNLALSLLATGLVAVAFQPLRARVQRTVDRFVFGERDDPYAVLSRLGHRIEDTLGAADLLPQIVRTTAEALRLPYAALFLDRAGGPELVAVTGSASRSTLRLPLTYQGQPLGALEVAQRSPGDAFSAADRRLLEDLARQIGIAAHTVTLADELQRSREAIITSREEERRRLRRDLHDGLGAQLAALIMQTGTIRSQLQRDPGAAERDLNELRDELKTAIDDVRRLVHGLRPPALDELGLAGAIRARLDRIGGHSDSDGPGLQVRLNVQEPMPALPAAVEVAALRIVDEAIINVVRHAHARAVTVTMEIVSGNLAIRVEDDGAGLDVSHVEPGIGLQSMRDRARELGGTWSIAPGVGGYGTMVHARLPVAGDPR